ncbi:MAG: T9SS type A sorting domain-containing protein [Saprospiraceae bacterium]|nr:T9SS type A sorting domain-containing protein [Saprospiraceae bacterium]
MFKYNSFLLAVGLLLASLTTLPAAVLNFEKSDNTTFSPPPLPAPANFHVTGFSATSIAMAWDAVPGASSYMVEAFLGNSPTPFAVNFEPGTTTTFNNLTPNTMYRFEVAGIDANNQAGDRSTLYQKTGIIIDLVVDYQPNNASKQQVLPMLPGGNVYQLPKVPGVSYWFKIQQKKGGPNDFVRYEFAISPVDGILDIGRESGGLLTYAMGRQNGAWHLGPWEDVEKMRISKSTDSNAPSIGDVSVIYNLSNFELYWWPYNDNTEFEFTVWELGPQGRNNQNSAAATSAGAIQISPNPFQSTLQISGLNPAVETNLQLFRYDGTLVQAHQSTAVQKYNLLTSDLPAGVYFLRTSAEGIQKTHKLVKSN